MDDKELDFSPEKGNGAFASAHDGWAFRISQFARLYADRMGLNAVKLAATMWGDWGYDTKLKRAVNSVMWIVAVIIFQNAATMPTDTALEPNLDLRL